MEVRLFKPHIGKEELKNIEDVFGRAWLGLGPKVTEFEKAWSNYIRSEVSVAVNSATAALHLALAVYRFKKGKKVLVPAITFISTATAAIYNGLEPVFVDVDANTVTVSLEDLNRKVTKDCVAVIPVHFGGHPVEMDALLDFARTKGLIVIEDCAHCAGGVFKGRKLGTWGDVGCFSFEEKKCMTTGDGGMICTNNVELAEPLRAYRWVGIDKDTWKRKKGYTDTTSRDAKHWHYEISVLGYKYNMNDLAAAIGLAQLKKLDKMNAKRGDCIEKYMSGIRGLQSIAPLLPYAPDKHVYWLFGIRCKKRDELIIHLKSKGIATGVHYMPLTLHPLFKEHAAECPVSNKIWETFITLPLHADLTDGEIDYVVDALEEFDQKSQRRIS